MNTPMRLLIAYDGSDCAKSALDDLRRAGLPDEAEATVISVAELWPPPPSTYALAETDLKETAAGAVDEAGHLAVEACERIHYAFPRWSVRPDAKLGSPARRILEAAEAQQPDLVVVGSHGRSAFGRFVLGSVSQRVVASAICSVRVARGTTKDPNEPLRIVVGLKQAPSGDAAVRALIARSWPAGSQVRLVTSFGPYHVFDLDLEEILRRVADMHQGAVEALLDVGLNASSVVTEGDPKKALVELAADWKADTIFVGTRDLNEKGRALLGSVSLAVVGRAPCSVEVVRD